MKTAGAITSDVLRKIQGEELPDRPVTALSHLLPQEESSEEGPSLGQDIGTGVTTGGAIGAGTSLTVPMLISLLSKGKHGMSPRQMGRYIKNIFGSPGISEEGLGLLLPLAGAAGGMGIGATAGGIGHALRKESQAMNKELREKVAAFIEHTGVLKEARLGQIARQAGSLAAKAKGPMAGVAAGAGGVMGLSTLGQRDQETQQAAAEMRQLLEAYPELMYEIPGVGGGPGQGMGMGQPGMGPGMGPGGGQMDGSGIPPELLYILQQQAAQQQAPQQQMGGYPSGPYG
jgi:hypothetical protein